MCYPLFYAPKLSQSCVNVGNMGLSHFKDSISYTGISNDKSVDKYVNKHDSTNMSSN